MSALKEIRYRGGIARFKIPASWSEEYDPAGGAQFFEDRPDSGTLRLNVISFSSNGKQTGDEMVGSLMRTDGYSKLHDGLAIKQSVTPTEEEGMPLHLYHWQVAIPVEECNARLAIFTYTVLASKANDRQVQQEIELLGRCIREGTYSRETGVTRDFP